jgi:hypothetical protein
MHQTKAAVLNANRPTLVGGAAVLDNRHRKRSASNLAAAAGGPSGLAMSKSQDGAKAHEDTEAKEAQNGKAE